MGLLQKRIDRFLSNNLIVNKKDGSILVKVPEGEFEMGDGEDNDCPKHRVWLSSYYIGVYCVTNRQYKQFIEETGHRPPDEAAWEKPIWHGRKYSEEYADHPVVCVDWDDAVAYCRWARLRLPTEAEWEKAARGPKGYKYPWGDNWYKDKCRNNTNRGSGTTCPVYGYPEGVSGYGVYNMSGNVWEWVADWYGSGYYRDSPARDPRGPETGSFRVFHGGRWSRDDARGFRAANRFNGAPSYRGVHHGFRVTVSRG